MSSARSTGARSSARGEGPERTPSPRWMRRFRSRSGGVGKAAPATRRRASRGGGGGGGRGHAAMRASGQMFCDRMRWTYWARSYAPGSSPRAATACRAARMEPSRACRASPPSRRGSCRGAGSVLHERRGELDRLRAGQDLLQRAGRVVHAGGRGEVGAHAPVEARSSGAGRAPPPARTGSSSGRRHRSSEMSGWRKRLKRTRPFTPRPSSVAAKWASEVK